LCGKNKRLPEGTKEAKEIKAKGRNKETSKKYNYGMRNHRYKGRKEASNKSKTKFKTRRTERRKLIMCQTSNGCRLFRSRI